MIRYALSCEHEHAFEGWFSTSDDFDDQARRGLLECPLCGSKTVDKQIMAPAVAGTKARAAADQAREMMMEARRHIEETFDDVGDAFADEARAIHEGRAEERGIYGEATGEEVKSLLEEGVPVAPMPPAAKPRRALN